MLFALGKYKPKFFSKDVFSYFIWEGSDIGNLNNDYENAALNIIKSIKSAREWKEVAEHIVVIKDDKCVYYEQYKNEVSDILRFMYALSFI